MNIGLIIWFIMGGLILHFFMANFLNMMLMKYNENPIDTVEKINELGLIPILVPSGSYYKEFLDGSKIPVYQELGKRAVIPEDWDDCSDLIQRGIVDSHTHVLLASFLPCCFPYKDFDAFPLDGHPPWYVWIINRRWQQKEQLTMHIMIFQQVHFCQAQPISSSRWLRLAVFPAFPHPPSHPGKSCLA